MKLFVAGAPCSGKTTLVRYLRDILGVVAVDMDDEILRANGGTWPDIPTKNAVVTPKALEHVLALPDVILFDSYMIPDHMQRLRDAGFGVVLIEVSEAELRRRDAKRQAEEGWSNFQWFDHNQARLEELRASGFVDLVVSGERGTATVATDILRFARTFSAVKGQPRSEFLYKVTEPRADQTFEPRPFWRTEDWSWSDDEEHPGLIEDCVLYAAGFDEVTIHLLPKVWRACVRLDEVRSARLTALGFSWTAGSRAVIFALEPDRVAIESFAPTIFAFERAGFEETPTNEFISRAPRTAVSAETVPFQDAARRWRFEVVYVGDADALIEAFQSAGVDYEIQT